MKCSFGKFLLRGCFEPVWKFGTELYCRLLYIENGGEQCLIAAFDLLGTYPPDAARWRREVSARTGIPERGIWFHELQIHASPEGEAVSGAYMDEIINRTATEAKRMINTAEEFDCFACKADLGDKFSMNREQYVDGLGGVTIWTGMSFDDRGKPYSQNPDIMLLRGYKPKLPAFESPIWFDNRVDQLGYLFVFKSKDGRVLGSVSRFAAHPDVAVLFELRHIPHPENEYHYDYDWPGYMSDEFERTIGGISMYLNGPCADLATKKSYDGMDTYEASAGDCRRIADAIGAKLASEFAKSAEKVDTSLFFGTESYDIKLPMKEDIPHNRSDIEKQEEKTEQAQAALDRAIAEDRPAWEVKKLIDERWRAHHIKTVICQDGRFTDEELASHEVTVSVTALRFGGYLFVGVPGESLVDMTLWLRSRFTGAKTIPVDQVGGYYNYMATPRSMTLGGYTYWASWVRRDATDVLKQNLAPLLDSFLSK